mmetsp:Transcript_6765/g.21784  ORF Transcript_6765/g.21784 Transcript_6765/m.21784 type:complete len:152 (+) Transcript_6765:39-494(+)
MEPRCRCDEDEAEDWTLRGSVEAAMPEHIESSDAYAARFPSAALALEVRILELCELSAMYCARCGRLFVDAALADGRDRSYWGIRSREDVDTWMSWEMRYVVREGVAGRVPPDAYSLAVERGWVNSVGSVRALVSMAADRQGAEEERKRAS